MTCNTQDLLKKVDYPSSNMFQGQKKMKICTFMEGMACWQGERGFDNCWFGETSRCRLKMKINTLKLL